jgi:ATP-dependent Clp protease ATP-binding subunit ClpC
MFEKFTEQARRVIFFANIEAREFGAPTIDTELLLIGIFREYPKVLEDLGGDPLLSKTVENEIRSKIVHRDKIPTTVDLPLSDACKRVLECALNETPRLNHPKVTVHHLMVAILHEESSVAAQILMKSGLSIAGASQKLVELGRI